MRIGRFDLGIIKGSRSWGLEQGSCECVILSLGRFYTIWLSKNCKCSICNQYECECVCVLCQEVFAKCDCEKFK